MPRWPRLVPPGVCKVPIVVTLTDGIDEDGAPAVVRTISTHCNYNGGGGWTVDEQRQAVRCTAAALFDGDIVSDLPRLTGWVDVFGVRMTIHAASRARNPDGTVNYTRLELL